MRIANSVNHQIFERKWHCRVHPAVHLFEDRLNTNSSRLPLVELDSENEPSAALLGRSWFQVLSRTALGGNPKRRIEASDLLSHVPGLVLWLPSAALGSKNTGFYVRKR